MSAPFVIALEGPSYSGKSTLGSSLATALGTGACLLPCYVDVAGGDAHVPPSRADTADGQLASLRVFVDLDRRRSEAAVGCIAQATWVVADRCWLSLLAHVHAVARTGGPDVCAAAESLLQASADVLAPSAVLYLAVSEPLRRERIPVTAADRWNAEASFNAALDAFYRDVAPQVLSVPMHVLDGDTDPAAVCDQALAIVAQETRTQEEAS